MSREMLDSLGGCDGLVGAVGVECEVAQELAVEVDDADVSVGDEELHGLAFVGSSDADFVEATEMAQADLASVVDLVLADPEVGVRRLAVGLGLDAGAVGLQRCAAF